MICCCALRDTDWASTMELLTAAGCAVVIATEIFYKGKVRFAFKNCCMLVLKLQILAEVKRNTKLSYDRDLIQKGVPFRVSLMNMLFRGAYHECMFVQCKKMKKVLR